MLLSFLLVLPKSFYSTVTESGIWASHRPEFRSQRCHLLNMEPSANQLTCFLFYSKRVVNLTVVIKVGIQCILRYIKGYVLLMAETPVVQQLSEEGPSCR